jgi:hypothetical protein
MNEQVRSRSLRLLRKSSSGRSVASPIAPPPPWLSMVVTENEPETPPTFKVAVVVVARTLKWADTNRFAVANVRRWL